MAETPFDELPLVPAVCLCGYKGKSRQPRHYRCGYCYYAQWAKGIDAQVLRLQERIKKYRAKAAECRRKAAAFKRRHPEAGGPPDVAVGSGSSKKRHAER